MHGIGWRPFAWDFELGYFLFTGISGGIGCDVVGSAVGVNMLLTSLAHVHSFETFDDCIRMNLIGLVSSFFVMYFIGQQPLLHGVKETLSVDFWI